eukprot:CAMPEP_0173433038 /NCGR_PEP_ID=MMETSP1357-20121228/10633_1 /TAXON_ID=77926 /ORGANISM="Hemiselmis rufescens, Strain PCC563" /LENGTH=66 /DNA_ID=CAMNT_0014397713 /DNA_START=104 /DNA_END=301 /DNA_ORIENTATION=-
MSPLPLKAALLLFSLPIATTFNLPPLLPQNMAASGLTARIRTKCPTVSSEVRLMGLERGAGMLRMS